jgi:hypothetical protein
LPTKIGFYHGSYFSTLWINLKSSILTKTLGILFDPRILNTIPHKTNIRKFIVCIMNDNLRF